MQKKVQHFTNSPYDRLLSCSSEVSQTGLSSGLLVDWLEHLDPEVTSVCPDLQQKLLFALNKVQPFIYSPILSSYLFTII